MSDATHKDILRADQSALLSALERAGADVTKPKSMRCPFHDDTHPSASVYEKDGIWRFKCHGGSCGVNLDVYDVLARVEKRPVADVLRATKPSTDGHPRPVLKRETGNEIFPTAEAAALAYGFGKPDVMPTYRNANGEPLQIAVRWNRPGGKKVLPVAPVPGGWIKGGMPAPRAMFNLPEINARPGEMLVVAEGELKGLLLTELGYVGTCSANGAGSADKTDWTPCKGRHVVVFIDHDAAGERYGKEVSNLAYAAGALSVRIVRLAKWWSHCPEGGDIVDYVNERREEGASDEDIRAELDSFIAEAEVVPPPTPSVTATESDAVELPGGPMPVGETARNLGERLAKSGTVFERGGVAMMLRRGEHGQPELHPLRPAAAPSLFETAGKLTKDGKPATCGEATARLILSAGQFLAALPPVRVLSRCPVLVARGDELVTVNAYDRESGVLASGGPVPEMTLAEARAILDSVISDFRFVRDGDRARALAALITPALVFGGILGGRAPLDVAEADESQTGKGYFFKLRAAIYGSRVRTVVQRKGGVGSFDESISGALVSGAPFVSFDNLRGRIDSPALESLLTEPTFAARVSYAGEALIDATRVAFSATSNRAEMTPDLANRASIIRLLHQPPGYTFTEFPDGDLLAHIEGDPARFLGAVFAAARAWWNAGRPTTGETAHSFRAWAGRLDWMTRNLLGAGPLLGGMAEAKTRLSNPALGWLRAVVLAAVKAGMVGRELRAHDLLTLAEDNPDLALPGSGELDTEDEAGRSVALKAIGRQLGRAFGSRDVIAIDGYSIARREDYDSDTRKPTRHYEIERVENIEKRPVAPNAPNAPGGTTDNLAASPPDGDSAIRSMGGPGAMGAHGRNGRNPQETQVSLIDAAPTPAAGWREVTL